MSGKGGSGKDVPGPWTNFSTYKRHLSESQKLSTGEKGVKPQLKVAKFRAVHNLYLGSIFIFIYIVRP